MDPWEEKNIKKIIKRNRQIAIILDEASRIIAKRIQRYEMKHPDMLYKGEFFKYNRQIEKNIDAVMKMLAEQIDTIIRNGMVTHWQLANLKNNEFVKQYIGALQLPSEMAVSFNQLNLLAMNMFIDRTEAGMNLSKRIWKLANGMKNELEVILASGIITGRSAAESAREIKKYLKEPDKLFRRVRREGKLVLSKRAKAYHPGRGVYRSSYKNALRITASENNMAFRMSDYHRRQQLPFITGIRVQRSPTLFECGLCDAMVGDYPPGFIFTCWHSSCRCYSTSIKLDKKDFANFIKIGRIDTRQYVRSIQKPAQNYIIKNKEKIKRLKSEPYFIRDNFTKDFKLKKEISIPKFDVPYKIKKVS